MNVMGQGEGLALFQILTNERHALVIERLLIGQYFQKLRKKVNPPCLPLTLHLKSPTQTVSVGLLVKFYCTIIVTYDSDP